MAALFKAKEEKLTQLSSASRMNSMSAILSNVALWKEKNMFKHQPTSSGKEYCNTRS